LEQFRSGGSRVRAVGCGGLGYGEWGGAAFAGGRAKGMRARIVNQLPARTGAIFRFEFDEFILVFGSEARGWAISFGFAVIAEFLQVQQFFVDAAEEGDGRLEFGDIAIGAGGESGFAEEQLGKADGGGLEADLGQVGRVIAAVILEEIVLTERGLEGVVVEGAPFGVAAVGDPIRDVAFGDDEAELFDGLGDFLIGNAAANEAADQIAFVLGQGSDGAGARAAVEQAGFGGRRSEGGRSAVDDGRHASARRGAADEGQVLGFRGLPEGGEEGGEGISLIIHMRCWSAGAAGCRGQPLYVVRKVKRARIPGEVKISGIK